MGLKPSQPCRPIRWTLFSAISTCRSWTGWKLAGVENAKGVPVVMITTEGSEGHVVQALSVGARGYIRKPFTPCATTEKDAEATFDALAAGAFDYVPKQLSPASLDIFPIRADLLAKIHAAARSRNQRPPAVGSKKPPTSARSENEDRNSACTPAIFALGTSTGGPKALQEILPLLPRDLSVPILIVQHMPNGFTAPFAQRMNALCSLTVREATHGATILPGLAYMRPVGCIRK